MEKLSEYIIDTQGVLSPEDIFRSLTFYSTKLGKSWSPRSGTTVSFEALDSNEIKFKIKHINNSHVNSYEIQDIYVLTNRFTRALYMKAK